MDAGNYLSKTRGSQLDINVIVELEDVFYQILNELERWKLIEAVDAEVVIMVQKLAALSSSLVTKINRDKDTDTEFFTTALQLGTELLKFSKNMSVIIPVAIWADIILSN